MKVNLEKDGKRCALLVLSGFLALICASAVASENTGYSLIKEVKVWTNYIDVYSEELSVCSKSGHKDRYILSKDRDQTFSIVVAAMASEMKVSISYACGDSGVAEINGVRVKAK